MKKTAYIFTLLFVPNTLVAQKTSLPIMESLFGPTSTNACVGNNKLTVGISKYGELVNLRWPCSNYYDHLNYKTLYPMPWGTKVEDYDRFLNASAKQGSYPALQYSLNNKIIVSQLRSVDWEIKQSYLNDNSPIVVTSFINKNIGIKVTNTDVVSIDKDVLMRHYKIEKLAEINLTNVKLIYLSNMAPCNYKPNFNPGGDWVNDEDNGFANVYDKSNDCFISFNPNKESRSKKKLPSNDTSSVEVNNFIANMGNLFPTYAGKNNIDVQDIYCSIGTSAKYSSVAMYEDKGRKTELPDLLTSNNIIFAKQPAILVSWYGVVFSKNNSVEVDIIFTFSNTLKNSLAVLKETKEIGYKNILNTTVDYWDKKLGAATLPLVNDAQMTRTLKRTLINMLISTNSDSGGIGSSVSATQPPYTMLWMRDAAIMGFVLDLAGYHEEAEKNNLFFTTVQRKKDFDICKDPLKFECHKGTWFQCYYADGKPSWMYDFEIDEVGWGAWSFYVHALFLQGEQQKAYLQKVFPSIELAANFIESFKDPFSNLQRRAREDDVMWQDQSIYGAASVLLGLKAAVSAAKLLNENDKAATWQKRITELEKAINKWLWNKKTNEYQQAVYGNFGGRAIIVWPALLASYDNERIQGHAKGLSKQIHPFFIKADDAKNKEWWYLGKATAAIAFAVQNDDAKLDVAKNYLSILLKDACTQDTFVYGETSMVRDVTEMTNGKMETKRIYDNRVGQPSNHPAAWIYMTAEMLYGKNKTLLNNLYK
jgi:GH15 family glucan-1,4-alpha-glucosidase